MSETNYPNPFLAQPLPDDFPGLNARTREQFGLSEQVATALNQIRDELIGEGESIFTDEHSVGWMKRQFGDPRILEGLARIEAGRGTPVKEFVRHSFRYFALDYHREGFGELGYPYVERSPQPDGYTRLPVSPANLHQDGRERRHEEGAALSLKKLHSLGVDPSKVLYYRVTQPSDKPKPEYYWTSDSVEVRRGLDYELGKQTETAIVLVSTLEDIAQNGGLILDINDDQGVAVRQVGLGAFDQRKVLFSFPRNLHR